MIHGGIVSRPATKQYRDNFDRVFGKKKRDGWKIRYTTQAVIKPAPAVGVIRQP